MRQASERPIPDDELTAADLREIWSILSLNERVQGFRVLPRDEAESLLFSLTNADLTSLIMALKPGDRRYWVRLLPPDDIADLIQCAPAEERDGLLGLLDERTRHEVNALLAYAEDEAGGLMNPRYARVRGWVDACRAHPAAQQVTREQIVKLYYDYAKGAGNGALLPGRRQSSFAFEPDWRARPWPPRDKYRHSASDAELGL